MAAISLSKALSGQGGDEDEGRMGLSQLRDETGSRRARVGAVMKILALASADRRRLDQRVKQVRVSPAVANCATRSPLAKLTGTRAVLGWSGGERMVKT